MENPVLFVAATVWKSCSIRHENSKFLGKTTISMPMNRGFVRASKKMRVVAWKRLRLQFAALNRDDLPALRKGLANPPDRDVHVAIIDAIGAHKAEGKE